MGFLLCRFVKSNHKLLKVKIEINFQFIISVNINPFNEEIAENYKPLAKLINNTLDWLYDNVDGLAERIEN